MSIQSFDRMIQGISSKSTIGDYTKAELDFDLKRMLEMTELLTLGKV